MSDGGGDCGGGGDSGGGGGDYGSSGDHGGCHTSYDHSSHGHHTSNDHSSHGHSKYDDDDKHHKHHPYQPDPDVEALNSYTQHAILHSTNDDWNSDYYNNRNMSSVNNSRKPDYGPKGQTVVYNGGRSSDPTRSTCQHIVAVIIAIIFGAIVITGFIFAFLNILSNYI